MYVMYICVLMRASMCVHAHTLPACVCEYVCMHILVCRHVLYVVKILFILILHVSVLYRFNYNAFCMLGECV